MAKDDLNGQPKNQYTLVLTEIYHKVVFRMTKDGNEDPKSST